MADAQARVLIQVRETEWLRAVHGVGRFVLRGDAQARLAVGTALGAPLPAVTGRAFAQGPCAALSLGPDEHLFIVAESEVTTFLAELDSALAGLPHSLVDVSHRQVSLELRGAYARATLAFNAASADLILKFAANLRPADEQIAVEEESRVAVVAARRNLWAAYAKT